MEGGKVFGAGGGAKAGEADKLNIDSIIARLLEGKKCQFTIMVLETGSIWTFWKVTGRQETQY